MKLSPLYVQRSREMDEAVMEDVFYNVLEKRLDVPPQKEVVKISQ